MTGYARLFSACFISQAAGGGSNASLGIDQAWMWLSRVLNLRPCPTITAIMLTHILTVCGRDLTSVYGRQAWKLIAFVHSQFLPAIRSVTDENKDGGACEKLALFIDDAVNRQQIEPVDGRISQTFWYT